MADGLYGLSQRLPPANLQAEQGLLGALLANNRSFERVADFLEPHHFADPIHGRIFRQISERILNGQLADALSMKVEFEHAGILDEVGGTAYLSQLLSSMVGLLHAAEYGRTIVDCWIRRQLIEIGEGIVNNAFGADPEIDGRKQIDAAEQALSSLGAGGRRGDRMSSAGSLVSAAIAQAEAVYQGKPSGRVLTGMLTIDRAFRLVGGDLTLLAGPPGAGKTAIAIQMGTSLAKGLLVSAIEDGLSSAAAYRQPGVAVFSLEMSGEQLGQRIAAHEADIPLDDLLEGRLDMVSALGLKRAESALANIPLRVWDCTATPLRLIGRKIRMHLANQPELLVIIDHLLVSGDDDADKKRFGQDAVNVGQLAGSLKSLARETNLPFIVLTHTPRPMKGVEVRRPTRFDVKYAGEGVADNVVFVHRPIMFMDSQQPKQGRQTEAQFSGMGGTLEKWRHALQNARDLAEIVVAKQRQGREGVYRMRFKGSTTSFHEVDDPNYGEE